ncbi:hypothetical protein LJC59_03715 [Desulfovibrio sp. OttesenSCG-928-A18]|nr:hypothetical protein [Desulfovibrio sp. OttesenSCG-928-A18]
MTGPENNSSGRRLPLFLLLTAALFALFACAGKEEPRVLPVLPSVALAMKGPSLYIVGEYEGMRLMGDMDRTAMAGHGALRLHDANLDEQGAAIVLARLREEVAATRARSSALQPDALSAPDPSQSALALEMFLPAVDGGAPFVCEARIDAQPTEKGRVRGMLHCSGNRHMPFSLRNLGPDQGVGIGRERDDGELLVLFYHSSPDEAERRFPQVQDDIRTARSMPRAGGRGD